MEEKRTSESISEDELAETDPAAEYSESVSTSRSYNETPESESAADIAPQAQPARPHTDDKPASEIRLSPSVTRTVYGFGTSKITAAEFVGSILQRHTEYGDGKAVSTRLNGTSTRKTAPDWIADIKLLIDPARMTTPVLHGRIAVIGLALLEPDLRRDLEKTGAFEALVNELKEPLLDILTRLGRATLEPAESVPNWSDDPVSDPDNDLLGRLPFARFLARRIAVIPPNSEAYSIHIYGPWGAGKTTLLNFLQNELEERHVEDQKDDWIVVDFNAWRHQHIQPPWWSLMERVFQVTKRKLSFWNRLREYWWRINSGRAQYFFAVAIIAWILALVVFPLLRNAAGDDAGLKSVGTAADNVSKILALIATVWGAVFAFQRSLLFGSAKAAQNYAELIHDPANQIKQRFTDLIKRLRPSRVAILVDDLDRCQSQYVVDLLEGIQTLFRAAPVVFIVAADRNWLNACYEEVYEKLRNRIHAPGKPLGTLFLEKAFRFSTAMPGIPEQLRQEYWQHLLRLSTKEGREDLEAARAEALNLVRLAQSESDVRKLVNHANEDQERTFSEKQAIREAAAVRLASPKIIKQIEHTLRPYAPLLEPNPRGMKLLVNAYSATRALSILSEVNIGLHQLALWTILSGRWPQLADYLVERPEALSRLREGNADGFDENIRSLVSDPHVLAVIGTAETGLSKEAIEKCGRMQT
jgi:hypothetical protein